jgi:hypothetical protein
MARQCQFDRKVAAYRCGAVDTKLHAPNLHTAANSYRRISLGPLIISDVIIQVKILFILLK